MRVECCESLTGERIRIRRTENPQSSDSSSVDQYRRAREETEAGNRIAMFGKDELRPSKVARKTGEAEAVRMTHLRANVWCVPRGLTLRSEDQSAQKNCSNLSRTAEQGRHQDLGSRDVDSSARMCTHGLANAP